MELCEIRENINKLKKTSLLSPRREYYINRISQSLQIAFKEHKDDEELTKLSQEFCEERAENNSFNIYNIFRRFNDYKTTGNLIINVVGLRDLLRCRECCKNLLFLENEKVIEYLSSAECKFQVASQLYDYCFKTFKVFNAEDKFLKPFNVLGRILISLSKIEQSDRFKTLFNKYCDLKDKFIEYNKAYYYRPEEFVSVSKSSAFSRDGGAKSIREYKTYYAEKFSVRLARVFYTDIDNFREEKEKVFNEIESLDVDNDVKDFIKVCANPYVASSESNLVGTIKEFNDLKESQYLCYLDHDELVDLYNLCRDFYDSFDKKKIISYVFFCAKATTMSEGIAELFDRKSVFLEELDSLLDNLIEYDVISPEEKISLIEVARNTLEGGGKNEDL